MTAIFADEFFSGVFCALACRGVRTLIVDDALHAAMECASLQIAHLASDLDVRFRVRVHPVHRDSEVVREGISRALAAGIATLRAPHFKTLDLIVDPSIASRILAALPGGADLYESLAGVVASRVSGE